MNTVINLQEPPSGQGWIAPGTCGDGRWTRVLPNGIFESWAPESANTVTIGTSATAGSPWGLSTPAAMDGGPVDNCGMTRHEIQTLISDNVNLKHAVAAYEDIEYGSPNPDESRAALARVQALCDEGSSGRCAGGHLATDRVRAAIEIPKAAQ